MYKKVWCTCEVVVLLIKHIVFDLLVASVSLDLKVPFIKPLQQHGHEFWHKTTLLVEKTLKNSARFLLVFSLIHGIDKHHCLLVQLVLNRFIEYELNPVNTMFVTVYKCWSIFLKNSSVVLSLFIFYRFCFSQCQSDLARSNNFARSMCVSLRSKQRHQKQCLLFCQHLNYRISSNRQV